MKRNCTKRDFCGSFIALGALGAGAALGALAPLMRAEAAEAARLAFEQDSLKKALEALHIALPAKPSAAVQLQAPEIAENGNSVPVILSADLPRVQTIVLLVERNPRPLSVLMTYSNGTQPYLSTQVRLAETGKIYALVKSENQWHLAVREVRVTVGGCAPAA